jgi:transglutaminase-like putative cysteine protease
MTAVRTPGPRSESPTLPGADDRPRDADGRDGGGAGFAAELGLLALAFGTVAGFTRLFDTWSFLGRLAIPLVASWAIALVLRRVGVRTLPATLVHLTIGTILLTVMFAEGTHVLGLPTTATLELLSSEVSTSFSAFSRLIAPVTPTDGFLVVIAAGFWVFGLFADTAALRYSGPVQAAIPYVSTFLATGILAREHGRTAASVWFLGGLVLYAVTERMLHSGGRRWVGRSGRAGRRSIGLTAAAVGLVALVGGLALGPLLPGSTAPVVDLRDLGKGTGPRTVVSPFVGLRALLGVRSDTQMFTVRSDQPAYWRLTALEEFDESRDIWVSRGTYRRTDGPLPSDLDGDVPVDALRQDYSITGLSGLWLPGAYEPSRIRSETEVNYDRDSASIILRGERDGSTVDYQLDSVLPDFDAARVAPAGTAEQVGEEHLEHPPLSDLPADRLAEVLEGTSSDFERALALQDWFRTEFVYDESVDFRDAADPLAAFLAERRGFCQQFSSAFALMARAAGLPSRVAVGFTPGDAVAPTDDAPEGASEVQYVVRGRHAHAWPEIYFQGVGWVPFEPTPGRGDPQTSDLTGVEADQAEAPLQQQATTTLPATPSGEATVPTTTPSSPQVETVAPPEPSGQTDGDGGPTDWWIAGAGVAVVVVALGAGLWFTRRRGRRRSAALAGRVGDAWQRSTAWLSLLGLQPGPSETPLEFAARADGVLAASDAGAADDPAAPGSAAARRAITMLARAETDRRWGPNLPDDTAGDEAAHAAAEIEAYVRSSTSRVRQVELQLRR